MLSRQLDIPMPFLNWIPLESNLLEKQLAVSGTWSPQARLAC